jgi:UDP-N-acetyl-D-mannosaminuronic acid dehydrogenase
MNKNICVIGLGYIGLPTSLVFAKSGYRVKGVDINENIVAMLNAGELHIEENGLDDIYKEVYHSHHFSAQTKPESADVFIISVPTPVTLEKKADLTYVVSATRSILPFLQKGNIVIVESTIPPRTTDDVVARIISEAGWNVGKDVYLAHCPERVLPGKILKELVENNRIIGGVNKESAEKAADIYRLFVTGEIILTSATSAEMAKLMENTFRDVNIALANELTKISFDLGVNPLEVIRLANNHPRVNLHWPGPGVGGHCIAVDPYFITEKAPSSSPLLQTARNVNESMPQFVVDQVERLTKHQAKTITIFGITYKGNVDDTRESPALEIIHLLKQKGYELKIFDPYVKRDRVDFPLLNQEKALDGSELLLILTDHNEFKQLNESIILKQMKVPVIFDTKNIVQPFISPEVLFFNYGNLHQSDAITEAYQNVEVASTSQTE